MTTKVLFINTPFNPDRFLENDFFSKGKQAPLFPFGIAYIASYLLKCGSGYEVEILDIYAQQLSKERVIAEVKKTELEMLMNYGRYLFLHPIEFIKLSKKYEFSEIFKKILTRGIPYMMPYIKYSISAKGMFKRNAIGYKETDHK